MKADKTFFKKNLDFLMKEKGIGVDQVATEMKISPQNVNNWLSGRNGPQAKTLNKIAALFSQKPYDLINKDLTTAPSTKIKMDMGDSLYKIEAMSEVILSALAEVIAKQNNQLVGSINEELQKLVKLRLSSLIQVQ